MKTITVKILILLFSVLSTISISAQNLTERLETLSQKFNFTYEELKTDTFFSEKYLLKIEEPLNYNKPESPTFTQRVFLSHLGFDKPVVFITEGYAANYAAHPKYINELCPILNANQICVEHRYFGESVPDSLDWQELTIFNAASDHHRVVEILKNIYDGKWVNTGISKGGQTVMYHRYFYPDDVDASVAYVAPLNFSTEDKRVYSFLEHVGDSTCRELIFDFQFEMLENKNKYLPEFEKMAKKKNLTYKMGLERAYELTVFEYSFSFWQWGTTDCLSIQSTPDNPKAMIEHLNSVAGIDWISNEGIAGFQPFFYQALTEIGFYGYDISRFEGLTSFKSNPTFEFTAPEGVTVTYNAVPMQKVDNFIRHIADNMIFIYGETDPWSATSVNLTYSTNSIKIVKPGGSHRTRINNLLLRQKEIVIDSLKQWLEIRD
ncbi:MAG: hypothetical protein B6D61_12430 [Bacteroidetes bacterium 4484_249]|nr:MAG: hypothetical protein B6D61_12430 [Bacteroidetes bacterium 4484_249]